MEINMTRRALRRKLSRMADQLQILEVSQGWHYMMGTQLNQEYEQLQEHYELLTGKPFKYQQHA